MKALPIEVYRNNRTDSTNGGISSKYGTLLLICDEGYVDIDENNPPENLVKVSEHRCGFSTYKLLDPVARPQHLGWMFGGNLAYSSDSRYSRLAGQPLPIRDRQETQETYPVNERLKETVMKANAVRWRVSKDGSWYATESEIYELVQTIREVADLDTVQEVESWAKTASVGDVYEIRDVVVEMVELEETEVYPFRVDPPNLRWADKQDIYAEWKDNYDKCKYFSCSPMSSPGGWCQKHPCKQVNCGVGQICDDWESKKRNQCL